ncbi:MAG: aldo/keto reductase [Armatimonadota bacterium]
MDKGLNKRTLGRTGLEVTEVGLGGIPIIRVPFERAVKITHRALDLGINYIDTARAYRDSEAKIGEVMKTRREECYLTTKTTGRTRKEAQEQFATSLKELKTDYVDGLLLHDISTRPRWEKVMARGGAMEALKAARDKGQARFLGCSGHNVDILREIIECGEFDLVLLVYNLGVHNTAEVMRLASERGVGVTVMKPLSGGALMRLTKGRQKITPEIAWRFVLMNPDVDCGVAGATWLKDVHQAVKMSKTWKPLTKKQVERYTKIAADLGRDVCQNCQYCDICPEDIPVPEIMRMVDEARVYSYEWPRLRTQYHRLDVQADACTECGRCLAACPFDLPIIQRLQRAHNRLSGEI